MTIQPPTLIELQLKSLFCFNEFEKSKPLTKS
jgi:hypothetical protein